MKNPIVERKSRSEQTPEEIAMGETLENMLKIIVPMIIGLQLDQVGAVKTILGNKCYIDVRIEPLNLPDKEVH
jgi:hypothetical protein